MWNRIFFLSNVLCLYWTLAMLSLDIIIGQDIKYKQYQNETECYSASLWMKECGYNKHTHTGDWRFTPSSYIRK